MGGLLLELRVKSLPSWELARPSWQVSARLLLLLLAAPGGRRLRLHG